MKFNVGSYYVDIQLKEGVYVYDNESGTGKSFLAKLLRSYSLLHDDVLVMDYDNFDMDKLRGSRAVLTVIDRGSLFLTENINEIVNSLPGIVLIDAKSMISREGLFYDDCSILLEQGGVTVIP